MILLNFQNKYGMYKICVELIAFLSYVLAYLAQKGQE